MESIIGKGVQNKSKNQAISKQICGFCSDLANKYDGTGRQGKFAIRYRSLLFARINRVFYFAVNVDCDRRIFGGIAIEMDATTVIGNLIIDKVIDA